MNEPEPAPACPTCGWSLEEAELVRRAGPVETYRCPRCGHEVTALSEYLPDVPFDDTIWTVRLTWPPGTSAASVAKALRELLPEYRQLPLSQVLRRVAASGPVRVGDLVRPQADELRIRAEQSGLHAELEPTRQSAN